jgi:hypothetical protein
MTNFSPPSCAKPDNKSWKIETLFRFVYMNNFSWNIFPTPRGWGDFSLWSMDVYLNHWGPQLAICSKSPCSIASSSWPYLQDAISSSPPLQLSRKVVRTRPEHSSQSPHTLHYVRTHPGTIAERNLISAKLARLCGDSRPHWVQTEKAEIPSCLKKVCVWRYDTAFTFPQTSVCWTWPRSHVVTLWLYIHVQLMHAFPRASGPRSVGPDLDVTSGGHFGLRVFGHL